MKNLMIAVVIICTVSLTRAASIAWGSAIANPSDPTGMTAASEGWNAYLLYSASDLSSVATQIDKVGVGGTANNGASVVSVHTITADEAGIAFTFQGEYVADNVNGFYQMLIVDEANNKFGAVNQTFEVAGISDLNSPGEVYYNMDFGLGLDKFAGETGWSGTIGTSPVPTPEPTSGLLLLLGVAGMALRRRRG